MITYKCYSGPQQDVLFSEGEYDNENNLSEEELKNEILANTIIDYLKSEGDDLLENSYIYLLEGLLNNKNQEIDEYKEQLKNLFTITIN